MINHKQTRYQILEILYHQHFYEEKGENVRSVSKKLNLDKKFVMGEVRYLDKKGYLELKILGAFWTDTGESIAHLFITASGIDAVEKYKETRELSF